jgi:hypothetical protein
MKSPPVSWPKSKNWIFLWAIYEEKLDVEKFSWVSWEVSLFSHFSLVLALFNLVFKSDTQPEPIHACTMEIPQKKELKAVSITNQIKSSSIADHFIGHQARIERKIVFWLYWTNIKNP